MTVLKCLAKRIPKVVFPLAVGPCMTIKRLIVMNYELNVKLELKFRQKTKKVKSQDLI
jgi:hypothetical protein